LNNADVSLSQMQAAAGEVIDIDLFDNINGTNKVKELAKSKIVICYFNAGAREDWRPDADAFDPTFGVDYGQAMEGWEGENWVNVTSPNVRKIMQKRIELAAASGCHAVDPDNVDGFVSVLVPPSLTLSRLTEGYGRTTTKMVSVMKARYMPDMSTISLVLPKTTVSPSV
jgi:hypothetical protein